MPNVTTVASFPNNLSDGSSLSGGLYIDAAGNLYGVANGGGAHNVGDVYEITKTANGYSSTPTVLVSFDENVPPPGGGFGPGYPDGTLIADANGDLFGVTSSGGATGAGTVYEIVKTGGTYASAPTILGSFGGNPNTGLVMDAAGDLFGMTLYGGANSAGSIFEIAQTAGVYAMPATLVSFPTSTLAFPIAPLIIDSAGNLYGETTKGGANGYGEVFEIAKTGGSYAGTPMVLYSFDGVDANTPVGGLVMDSAGDLFGVTEFGGNNYLYGDGTVFEIAKTAGGYASMATTLVTMPGDASDGSQLTGLIIDSAGNLFVTASFGGPTTFGTIFEVAKTAAGYSSTPAIVANFDGTQQLQQGVGLVADKNGNLFIPQTPYPNPPGNLESVIEITGSGYQTSRKATRDLNGDGKSDIIFQNSDGTPAVWFLDGTTMTGGGLAGANPGTAWHLRATGDFDGDGKADLAWQNNDGTVAVWLMNGTTLVGGAAPSANPGPDWVLSGTGDFNGDGKSDLLFQNSSTGQVAIWELNGTTLIGGGSPGNPGTSWHIKGTGDFNGDGKSDILWQNDDGTVAIWLMDGTTLIGGGAPGTNPGTAWHVIGAGDFNGDGKSDILFQNSDGTPAIWYIDGTTMTGGGLAGSNPGTSWHAMGTGDYNGDGMADILWQNADGTPAVWLMNGTSFLGGGAPGANPGTSWHVIAATGG